MKYDIDSIENSTKDNAGGLCYFHFVPKEWIQDDAELSIASNIVNAAISLAGSYQWLKAQCMQDTMGYTEAQEETPAGTKYVQTLVGEINGDNENMLQIMNALPHHEYVVIYTDRQGQRKLIGNKLKGMSFQAVYAIGSKYVDKQSYRLTLVHESAERAPLYPY